MIVSVLTLGCKVNQYESDSIMKVLRDNGVTVTEEIVEADYYVVNTCAVTAEAERKSRQMISRIRAVKPDARIIIMGCASENNSEQFVQKGVDSVIGNSRKYEVTDRILCGKDIDGVTEMPLVYEDHFVQGTQKAKAYIKVQDGCNNYCSYCLIPYLRGRSRSRSIDSVLEEVAATPSREVILTGIDLSSYRVEEGGLDALVEALHGVDKRVRLGSLEVSVVTRELLQSLKGLDSFCPHFHLSLQSGSTEVLGAMNRHYTREEYINRCDLIREYFPDASITTDIIIGFPTETERDFEDTLDLMERVRFVDAHIFPYSPRRGTKAHGRLDGRIVDDRKKRIVKLKDRIRREELSSRIGATQCMLVEETVDGSAVGYTEGYVRCYLEGDYPVGDVFSVRFKAIHLDGMLVERV